MLTHLRRALRESVDCRAGKLDKCLKSRSETLNKDDDKEEQHSAILVHGRNSCEDSNGKINYFQSSADTASGGAERVSN